MVEIHYCTSDRGIAVHFFQRQLCGRTAGDAAGSRAESCAFCWLSPWGIFLAEGGVIAALARSYTDAVSFGSGVACALYCSFFRLITFGSGSGIAEVYYLNRKGMKGAEATGMSLVQYLIQKITLCLMGALSFFLLFYLCETVYRRIRGVYRSGGLCHDTDRRRYPSDHGMAEGKRAAVRSPS